MFDPVFSLSAGFHLDYQVLKGFIYFAFSTQEMNNYDDLAICWILPDIEMVFVNPRTVSSSFFFTILFPTQRR